VDIAQAAELAPISAIAENLGLSAADIEPYGRGKAKVRLEVLDRLAGAPDGKLVLVTALTATRAGDGKTVTSIGVSQALSRIGKRQCLCLRQPSLGPTFGIKGGAAGGGWSQVLPMEDINMHLTGDIHAVTTANNLLAACVDNHVYFDNELDIDPERITWRRVIDLCDRQLRNCEIGLGGKASGFAHKAGFDITAASEVMAVLALARDRKDLRERLGRMVVGWSRSGEPRFAREIGCVGALEVLLKDALLPNLVQTIEHTPVLMHAGPFANIAHGCNSVLATRMALKLADYAVTEAGFAADLGGEKFLHIKCRELGFMPAAVVLVATCRALKMHGGVAHENLGQEDVAALERGFANVRTHIENLRKFGLNVVVAINRFPKDTSAELDRVRALCDELDAANAVSEVCARGSAGGVELAEKVVAAAAGGNNALGGLYRLEQSLVEKIEVLAREIYRADGVEWQDGARAQVDDLERRGFGKLPLCMAKTQLSLSDDPARLGAPTGWKLRVQGAKVSNGAGFVVVRTGTMLLMPGMPKEGAAQLIRMDDDGKIHGLS
jgi:formate--tetrahydrofolate ligase